jgi:hypothetical protein
VVLSQILLYPVKSCAPQAASCWPLGPTGLLHDRQWALLDESGTLMTQKRCAALALVRPAVDLQASGSAATCCAGCVRAALLRPGVCCGSRPCMHQHVWACGSPGNSDG